LSVYKAQRSKRTQAWIFLFLEIELGELLFVAIPEEVVESVNQDPDFPRGLDFLFRFHYFLLSLLAFEVLDLEHHFRGDGAFLVEHGVGKGLLDDGADFSGDAEGDLMDHFKGMLVEDRFSCARQFEVMGDIVFGLFGAILWLRGSMTANSMIRFRSDCPERTRMKGS
jgi:hypothetical protein